MSHQTDINRALVLAAGDGTRLRNRVPKPALHILGVPLLARTLFTLEKAGITDAYVVLGYEADRVRKEIESIARLKIRIHWLYNARWEEPNGFSVLAAEDVLDEPFILTMSDHIYDAAVVSELKSRAGRLKGIDLAVDYNVDGVIDLDDATKVRLDEDRIVAIGKELPEFDAIDTGVFLASPVLFKALRESAAEGNASLSGGVARLAGAGLATVTDIGDRMWQDVDTPADVKAATRKLLAGVRKPTDGPIARYINRPISISISRLLVRTPVTPNMISVATLVLGLAAAGFAAVGEYTSFLMSGLLFQFASILDGSDGEVAKLTFRTSLRGEWVDTTCDNTSYVAFLAGLLVGIYRAGMPDLYLKLGLLGLASGVLSMANISIYLLRHKKSGSALAVKYGFQTGTGLLSRALQILQYLGKRDMMSFLVLILAVTGRLPLAMPMFGIGATFLLLPTTIKANLPAGWKLRRRKPLAPVRELQPVWFPTQDTDWFVEQERERVSESAAG